MFVQCVLRSGADQREEDVGVPKIVVSQNCHVRYPQPNPTVVPGESLLNKGCGRMKAASGVDTECSPLITTIKR